ncbi:MAG TPA: PAS domain S-box protein [Desulfobulbus sp.]|nr:PAS domain S-box protein [Desulfobulbus sp.]
MSPTITSKDLTLKEQVEFYSSLLDNCSDLIHSVSPEGKFLYVNQAWRDTLGYSEKDIEQLSLMDIIDDKYRKKCRNIFNALIGGERIDRNETLFITKDGRRIAVEGRCRTTYANGKAVSMTGIFRDISLQVKNNLALGESEQRFRTLFENSTEIMQMVATDGHFLHINAAWLQAFGYNRKEVSKLTIFDLIAPDCQGHCEKTFQQVLAEDRVHPIETTFIAKNGDRVEIEGSAVAIFKDGAPQYSQCIFRDVTEKRKMEEELLKAQKLESIGVFAGGLAHDFNNLLTAVLGNISLAREKVAKNSPHAGRLEKIETATLRAKGLTQQLLTFARGGAPIKKLSGIADLVKDSVDFPLRGSNIKQQYRFTDDLWSAEVDEDQLNQVIQNLVINARQAMSEGGNFGVTGTNITLGSDHHTGLKPGRYLLLTFSDQGPGISRQDQERIFDPYFSRKESGSGLGLAVAYAIMKKHDGLITVDSVPGKGTTFSLYLPAARKRFKELGKQHNEDAATGGNILIMDDEKIVRDVVGEMLNFLGYATCSAEHGEQAIMLYKKALANGRPYDAVLMDLTIPGGMGGKETMAELLEIDPEAKGIASSGYANDPIMAHFNEYGFKDVIPKPYQMDELRAILARTLPAGS